MKSNLHLLAGYGFGLADANNISAYSIDLDPANATGCKEARRVVLDLAAPLALPLATLACVEAAVGRSALLEAVVSGCEGLRKSFEAGAGIASVLSVGRVGVAQALRALGERVPSRPADSA